MVPPQGEDLAAAVDAQRRRLDDFVSDSAANRRVKTGFTPLSDDEAADSDDSDRGADDKEDWNGDALADSDAGRCRLAPPVRD